MSGVLWINDEMRALIAEALKRARAAPRPWQPEVADGTPTMWLELSDRKPGVRERIEKYPSQHLLLGTYHVAISFEHQPAGLFRHLSVSSNRRDKVPGLEVMQALVVEFGFSGWPLQRPNRVWMEEFEPKWHAVNVVELEP